MNPTFCESGCLTFVVGPICLAVVSAFKRSEGCHEPIFPNGAEALTVSPKTAEILTPVSRMGGFRNDGCHAIRVRPTRFTVTVGTVWSFQCPEVEYPQIIIPKESRLINAPGLGRCRGAA